MTLSVTIGGLWERSTRSLSGGTDVSAWVIPESLHIVNSIRDGSSTLSFTLRMPVGTSGQPQEGSLCQLTQNGSIVHAGPIRRTTQSLIQNASQKYPAYGKAWFLFEVECSDWTPWLDHRPVYGVYPNTPGVTTATAGSIIKAIIDDPSHYSSLICSKNILNGFPGNSGVGYDFGYTKSGGGSTIADGITIPVQNIAFQNFTQVIGEIARQIGFLWHVSSDRLIHFYDRLHGDNSPLFASQGAYQDNVLNLDTDVTNYGDFVYTRDTSQLITRVILLNASLRQPGNAPLPNYTDTFNGQHQFGVGYTPSTSPSDWDIKVWYPGNATTNPPNKEYNALNNNIKQEYVDGTTLDAQPWPDVAFVCQSNQGFRLGVAPPAGSTISANFAFFRQTMIDRWMWSSPTSGVTMDTTFPGTTVSTGGGQFYPGSLVTAMDDTSLPKTNIGAAEGSDGIYTRVISDSTLLMNAQSIGTDKCDQWLRRFGINIHLARFSSFTQGWRAGQSLTIQSNNWAIPSEVFYVQQVTMTPFFDQSANTWKLKSTVECSNNAWGS